MTNDITQPLTLAAGSHQAGEGFGCAMNVVSWELGEETISDHPRGVLREAAFMVQALNDVTAKLIGTTMVVPNIEMPMVGTVGFINLGDESKYVMPTVSLMTTRTIHLVPAEYSTRLLDVAHRTIGSDPSVGTRAVVGMVDVPTDGEKPTISAEMAFEGARASYAAKSAWRFALSGLFNHGFLASGSGDYTYWSRLFTQLLEPFNDTFIRRQGDQIVAFRSPSSINTLEARFDSVFELAHGILDRFWSQMPTDEHAKPEPEVVAAAIKQMQTVSA